jgi:hypothetical protein
MPCFVDSDNARQFFQDILDTSVYDLVRKYKLWCINQDKRKSISFLLGQGRKLTGLKPLNRAERRQNFASSSPAQLNKPCVRGVVYYISNGQLMVLNDLGKATGIKTLNMIWVNYKIDIVHKYGVELVGWPSKVAMVRPLQLRGQDVHLVVERLRNNTMRWIGLTKMQRDEVAAKVEELRQSGAAKPRRERSDKNQPRGPRTKKTAAGDADTDDSNNESSKDDGSGDESDKGDAGSGDGRPCLPIISPFVAVQSADSPRSPAPFVTAPSPIPIPTATSLASPAPAVPFTGGGCPVPSPIPPLRH